MNETYEQELGIFQRTWGLPGYDLKEMEETARKFHFVNEFLTNDSIDTSAASLFTYLMSKTLSHYLKTHTTVSENGKYMSSFSPQEFLDSFEMLYKAKYLSELPEDQEPTREKYAGATIEDLKAVFAKNMRNYTKPLPTLWKENLKKGTMDMGKLKEITDNAYDAMDKKY